MVADLNDDDLEVVLMSPFPAKFLHTSVEEVVIHVDQPCALLVLADNEGEHHRVFRSEMGCTNGSIGRVSNDRRVCDLVERVCEVTRMSGLIRPGNILFHVGWI